MKPGPKAGDGAAKPTIAFSHANGFPAGTYRLLLDAWRSAGYRVIALDKFGHDPAYPVRSNWPHQRDQLIDFVQTQTGGDAVHFVGHSLGGFVSLLAACKQPALARSLVLMDSPVVAGWRAHSVRVLKAGRLLQRLGPGRTSAGRRWRWPSAEAAWQHFAGKPAFARWHPDVLRDYIAGGTEVDADAGAVAPAAGGAAVGAGAGTGVRLAFRREVETQLYNTLPHHMGSLLRRHPPGCPVGFVGGTQSAEIRQAGMAATLALTQGRVAWVEGTHLFPMERPAEAAAAVLKLLG